MRHNRKILYTAGFMFSLPIALMSYINSSFISSFVSERLVGTIYTISSIVTVLVLLLVPKIFRKLGGYKFLLSVIALNALSILSFAFAKNVWSIVPLFVLVFTFNTLIIVSLDEFLKIFSKDSATGKIRGTYLTLFNLAWIVAQLSLATILVGFSFKGIYLVSFALMLLFFLISFYGLRNILDPKYDKTNTKKYLGEFFKNKNLFRAYGLNFLLQFFYSWMVIYTPIYLSLHLGFSWREIGIIFAIMLLPFVLLEFPLGKYSDKIGERKMLMFGFTITALSTLSLFFIQSHEIWIWALALFMTRVGAATIEVMNDTYFFKHITPENEEFIGIYRNTAPTAYIIGPIVALVVLTFSPSFNFLYIVLGAIMLYGIYLASTIRKSDI